MHLMGWLCFCAGLVSGLGPESSRAEQAGPNRYPYSVVCTTGMVADIVQHVAGEHATIVNLIGTGVDPHLYSATRGDIAKLINADMIFYNGLLLEGKMTDALIRVARKKPVHAVTELLDSALLLEAAGYEGHPDPHVWMDVSLWKLCAQKVSQTLAEFDPSHAEDYQSNYEQYARQLDALDAYAEKSIGSIPDKVRVLITAHDAFNYMGRAYGLEVRGIQGISTESEAGIQDINRLVDLIVVRNIQAVFVETSVPDKNVKALIEGAASRGQAVQIGGALFSDAMGKPGTYEGTYVGMIDHNITTITRALGGSAPPQGIQSKLLIEN